MVSVVIATRDRAEHVQRCLASVLSGPRTPDEVIVVDQSRDDETRRVAEGFDGKPVRWVHQSDGNLSLARNRGAELARSPYVAFLDDDGEVEPTWLDDVQRALAELGQPDALFGTIDEPPGQGLDRKAIGVSLHRVAAPVIWTADAHPAQPGFAGHSVHRRESFLAVGGFDPRLGPGSPLYGAEDIDLNYRLLRGGFAVGSSPQVRLLHHQWRDQAQIPRLLYRYNLAHSAFCAKHLRRGDTRVVRLVGRQLLDDGRMLGSAFRRRSRLRARAAAWRFAGTIRGLWVGWRQLSPPAA
jgi:glycosyltransferase involved in cell wall biosynthesis